MTTVVIPRVQENQENAARPARTALVADERVRRLQRVLFVAGALLMPLGLVLVLVGWYGAAHTPYVYDQVSYLMSGGVLGIGLTATGGFLYFGAWLATIAANQRDSARQLSDAVLALAEVVSRARDGATLVVAGDGALVHRRDCALVAQRDDLRPVTGGEPGLSPCRVCQPVEA